MVTNLPGRSLHRCEAGSKDLRTLRRNFLRRRIVEQLRGGCAGLPGRGTGFDCSQETAFVRCWGERLAQFLSRGADSFATYVLGKRDAGNPPVRFDEGRELAD